MEEKLSRRNFLRKAGIITAATVGAGIGINKVLSLLDKEEVSLLNEAEAAGTTLSIASKGSPEAMVKKAIDGLGGIGKFVKRGNSVAIKPNLAWAAPVGQAANTNPAVITALIKLCKQAGASRIVVVDHTCDYASVAFNQNGAASACKSAGVRLISADSPHMYRKVSIPKGKILKSDDCIRDILEADIWINVPIAKCHSGGVITASLKNLMGVNWDRGLWHSRGLHQCIADYASAVKPDLVVLDAIRILLTNGPKGPGIVKDVGQIIASTDPVAIDTYAATLLGIKPSDVPHIALAAQLGAGQMDMKKVTIKRV